MRNAEDPKYALEWEDTKQQVWLIMLINWVLPSCCWWAFLLLLARNLQAPAAC